MAKKQLMPGLLLILSKMKEHRRFHQMEIICFFTACDRPLGLGSCDLYFSYFIDEKWSEPSNLKWPVNTVSWESQPSISADGRTLYFSSSRPGGVGGKDIWYTKTG